MISLRAYDRHVEQVFEVVERLAQALAAADISYRVVGGFAVFVFAREKVRAGYPEAAPDFSTPVETPEGVLLAPVADLVRMKLTSFRLKDRVHLQDLDTVGLITAEIETRLPEVLLKRLRELRGAGEDDPPRG